MVENVCTPYCSCTTEYFVFVPTFSLIEKTAVPRVSQCVLLVIPPHCCAAVDATVTRASVFTIVYNREELTVR